MAFSRGDGVSMQRRKVLGGVGLAVGLEMVVDLLD